MSVEHSIRVAGTTELAAPVIFTQHALERLAERLWQLPDAAAADQRLSCLINHAAITATRPRWMHPSTGAADAWLVLGDIAFPLACSPDGRLHATTCIARGGIAVRRRPRRPRHRRHGARPEATTA